jgi:Asp-tRNA(Asn)/Glu-tRNA(Gln) amidotransferase A subunit family amidase
VKLPAAFSPALLHFSASTDSPRALLERCPSRLAEFEPTVGAFVYHDSLARRAADASTKRWRAGRPPSPIDGMPVGIKDIVLRVPTMSLPVVSAAGLPLGLQASASKTATQGGSPARPG